MNNNDNTEHWHSTKDPKTGRTYYYNSKTRATTWDKPIQLMTPTEREEKLRFKAETKKFFEEMESNIMKKIKFQTSIEPVIKPLDRLDSDRLAGTAAASKNESLLRSLMPSKPKMIVRTISSLDDEIVNTQKFSSTLEKIDEHKSLWHYRRSKKHAGTDSSKEAPAPLIRQTSHGVRRRNSTGTLFVGTTMSNQDNEATIHCVCAVIRSHMLDAAKDSIGPLSSEFDCFKDKEVLETVSKSSKYEHKHSFLQAIGLQKKSTVDIQSVPSLEIIRNFFNHIYSKTQMNSECIIITLIYLEKLVKITKGRFCIRHDNWQSVVFASMIMASKVWDDLSMWNVDFSHVLSSFDLHRVNELELAMLDALSYVVRVSAGEYAKYYFSLRSMMARLGFHANEVMELAPLDLAGARKLQIATEMYEQSVSDKDGISSRRPVSMQIPITNMRRTLSDGSNMPYQGHTSVGLEQIIHSDHMDADGLPHMIRKDA